MINLTQEQYKDLEQFLGHNLAVDGEWAVVKSKENSCTHVLNSKGTILVRLSCKDRRGYKQKPRLGKIWEDPAHYLICSVNNRERKLHRLVAETWLDDYNEELTVNHIDGNKHNNDYHNLEMLDVHDNCMHYHHSEEMAEQRARDYAYHGTTIKGRIHITDGVEARMIYEVDGIPEGWWRGRPQSMKDNAARSQLGRAPSTKGKIVINNGKQILYIDPNSEIPNGWVRGNLCEISAKERAARSKWMTGRLYIHKGKTNKRVYASELDSYLSDGWVKGMYTKRQKRTS